MSALRGRSAAAGGGATGSLATDAPQGDKVAPEESWGTVGAPEGVIQGAGGGRGLGRGCCGGRGSGNAMLKQHMISPECDRWEEIFLDGREITYNGY